MLREDLRHGNRRRDDRQAAYGLDLPGQEGHRRSRGDDDRIVLGDKRSSRGADRPLLGDILFLLLVDVAVADVGTYENGASVRAVELLLLFEVGQVLADGVRGRTGPCGWSPPKP